MINLKMKFLLLTVCSAVVAGVLFIPASVDALSVTVKRVVFEGSKRAEVITVINNSDKEETYRLGWKHFTMSERKGLKAVSEDELPPGVQPAKDMVKFSPRRFTLPPKGSQQVRMMLRMPAGVSDGEYRSHLWIRPEASVEDYRDRQIKPKGNKAGVSMRMLAGASMPVIVRKGPLEVGVNIQDLSISDQGNMVLAKFTLARSGGKSAYGDLDFVCNHGGASEYLLKFIRGVSIYSEMDRRIFSLKIPKREGKPACSSLMVRYTETDGLAGSVIGVFAEAEAAVQ